MMQKIFNSLKIGAIAACLWISPAVSVSADAVEEYDELLTMESISEVMRHLYRWYLDDSDFEGVFQLDTVDYHVAPLNLSLDPGDKSRYADVIIPSIGALVRMKKTNYRIEELDISVISNRFKIVNVEKIERDSCRQKL